jgi:signal transduction histidine kinase
LVSESLFEELKRYVAWSARDEAALKALHASAAPHFSRIADVFYEAILQHEEARRALAGGESQVGHLKVTLQQWLERLLTGPWDEEYFEARCRIGRRHVRINLPQHYMFGAMSLVRRELGAVVMAAYLGQPEQLDSARQALGRILDLELAIMLHTYREDLLSQQARLERLSVFGQLVGSIGHELRNPLAVVESSLYIARRSVSGNEKAEKHLERAGRQLAIAQGIITNLLDMIRDKPLTSKRLKLAEVVESAAAALAWPQGVSFATDAMEGLEAAGDAVQLNQVFTNLLSNAIEATSPAGQVLARGARVEGDVVIAIEDTGPGVDATTARRLFEPLITTKAHGTGLGLALVKRIAERHGGSVTYEPRVGGGALFRVRLPAYR